MLSLLKYVLLTRTVGIDNVVYIFLHIGAVPNRKSNHIQTLTDLTLVKSIVAPSHSKLFGIDLVEGVTC